MKDQELFLSQVMIHQNDCQIMISASDVDPIKSATKTAFTKNVIERIIWDVPQAEKVEERLLKAWEETNTKSMKAKLGKETRLLRIAIKEVNFPYLMSPFASSIYNETLPF